MLLVPNVIFEIPNIFDILNSIKDSANQKIKNFILSVLKDTLNQLIEDNEKLIIYIDNKDYSVFNNNFDIDKFLDSIDKNKELLKKVIKNENLKKYKDIYNLIDEIYTQLLKLDFNVNRLYTYYELSNKKVS